MSGRAGSVPEPGQSRAYLRRLADAIRAQVPEALIPADSDDLFLIYAVLALAKGQSVTAADVHNAWSAWMGQRDRDHRSIVPFDELPAAVREQDEPFVAAIRKAAPGGASREGAADNHLG